MTKILIIEARYYQDIANALLDGAASAIKAVGRTYDVITTTGAYELPATLAYAVNGKNKYDGYVLLGCVIRGQTTHYDHICDAVFPKTLDLSVAHKLALGMGVLTCENEEQAAYRADKSKKDYGGAAARAALRMIELKKELIS